MSNFLQEIENEFSRLRGRMTRLTPLDWQQAQEWEDDGVPLRLVLSAMGDGFKSFASQKRSGEINSIRYFVPLVKKSFAEWKESQIGKAPEKPAEPAQISRGLPEEPMLQTSFSNKQDLVILDQIADALTLAGELPERLAPVVKNLRGEILALRDVADQKNLPSGDIEDRLSTLRVAFDLELIVSVSAAERDEIIKTIKAEYANVKLTCEMENKIAIRKLYQKFNLPELTLYAI